MSAVTAKGQRGIIISGIPKVVEGKVGSATVYPGNVVYFDGTDWELVDVNTSEYGFVSKVGIVLYRARMDTSSPYGRKDLDDGFATGEMILICIGEKKGPLRLIIKVDPQAGSGTVKKYSAWAAVDTGKANCATAGTLMELTSTEEGAGVGNVRPVPVTNIEAIAYNASFGIFEWSGL